MSKIYLFLVVIIVVIGFNGCAVTKLTPEKIKEIKADCKAKEDKEFLGTFLYASGECLQYVKFNEFKSDEINIYLHGSYRSGGNPLPSYYNNKLEILANSGIPTYVIALPGYNHSTSNRFGRITQTSRSYLAAEYDYIVFVKEVLEAIKKKENAIKLNVIGHSAGATLATNISGLYPKLINKVAVYEGNYDMEFYNFLRGWSAKYPAITIMRNIGSIDKSTKFYVLYGKLSNKKEPQESTRFIDALKSRDINVESKEYPFLGHSTSSEVFHDIVKYLKKKI